MLDGKKLCLHCAYSRWPQHSEGECHAPDHDVIPTLEARLEGARCGKDATLFEDYVFQAFKSENGVVIRCKVCGIAHEKGQAPRHKIGCKCQPKPTKS